MEETNLYEVDPSVLYIMMTCMRIYIYEVMK